MKIYTIGFTKKSAERFFALLRESGAKRIVDVRLNNTSQLAGYAKRGDLAYFAKEIAQLEYVHVPALAPTPELLNAYRKGGDWERYAKGFTALMKTRRVEDTIAPALIDGGCLLCSCDQPQHCHRTLVASYLCEHWGKGNVTHLV